MSPICDNDWMGKKMAKAISRPADDEYDRLEAAIDWILGFSETPGVGIEAKRHIGTLVMAASRERAAALPPTDEFAWLIEDTRIHGGTYPLYYGGVGEIGGAWTYDHMKAVRYSRQEDAERAIHGLPNGWHLIGHAVQHGWAAPQQEERTK